MDTSEYQRAEQNFRAFQERLKAFIEEHAEFTIDGGLEFVDTRNRDRLAAELDTLKREHDAAGAAWAEALPKQKECVHG